MFVEDPLFVSEIAQTLVLNQDAQSANKSQKEKQLFMVNTLGRVLDALTLRHRLINAAWECELLSKVSMFLEKNTLELFRRRKRKYWSSSGVHSKTLLKMLILGIQGTSTRNGIQRVSFIPEICTVRVCRS